VQTFNQKFIFNTFMVYQTPWFKGQSGLLGRAAGGWIIAPIFTAGSGVPIPCATNSVSQSFGGSDALNFTATEQCVFTTPYTGGYHTHRGVLGSVDTNGISVGTSAQSSAAAHGSFSAINLFANPAAVFDTVRPPILGIDEKNSGNGPISGLPYWNMDVSIRKNFKIWESYTLEFSGVATNVFNHLDFANPTTSLASSTTFGVVSSQGNSPRSIQMGVRANF
jgi:hypothetical protein